MTKVERERRQKKSHKLMRSLGGRSSLGWYKHKLDITKRIYATIRNMLEKSVARRVRKTL